jgi:hypothetical protein
VFSKVGASNTVNTNFLHCFGGTSVDLGGRDALRSTLDHFRAGAAGGTDPYRRTSLAATVGWSAWAAVTGTPSPLQRELDAVDPRYAVVMFGTNDIQTRDLHRHGQSLLDLAELCAARGVIPLFTSVPPRDDDAEADRWVPRFTAVMRGVAQTAQMPFMDLERALRVLPGHGLGTDGIHMNAYPSGARACALTPEGLRYGFNVRNLLTLESLHRVRLVVEGGPAPDASAEVLRGAGTAEAPFEVPSLPFADARDTRSGGPSRIDGARGVHSARAGALPRRRRHRRARAARRGRRRALCGAQRPDVHRRGDPGDLVHRARYLCVAGGFARGALRAGADARLSGRSTRGRPEGWIGFAGRW